MRPIKIARNRFRDTKRTMLIYMTYVLTFPGGDHWMKQEQLSAHDLDLCLKNLIGEHARDMMAWRQRAMALWKHGECWWKDEAGVEHLIMLEKTKRPAHQLQWGTAIKNFGGGNKTETKVEA